MDRDKCTLRGLCATVCAMELDPGSHREIGIMARGNCLKCSRCPRRALCFPDRSQASKAA